MKVASKSTHLKSVGAHRLLSSADEDALCDMLHQLSESSSAIEYFSREGAFGETHAYRFDISTVVRALAAHSHRLAMECYDIANSLSDRNERKAANA